LIKEGKEAGKDVSQLETALTVLDAPAAVAVKPKQGEKKKVKDTERGTIIIE
jgi:hypothetical protein